MLFCTHICMKLLLKPVFAYHCLWTDELVWIIGKSTYRYTVILILFYEIPFFARLHNISVGDSDVSIPSRRSQLEAFLQHSLIARRTRVNQVMLTATKITVSATCSCVFATVLFIYLFIYCYRGVSGDVKTMSVIILDID